MRGQTRVSVSSEIRGQRGKTRVSLRGDTRGLMKDETTSQGAN